METLLEAVVVLAPAAATLALLRWLPEDWRALSPAVIGTAIGLSISIATYLWVFEAGSCDGVSSFSCRTNGNQGILAVLGIALGVIAIWATVLARTADDRRKRVERREDFETHLDSALGEVRHNLIHFAMAYDGERLPALPQFDVVLQRKLTDPKFSPRLSDDFRNALDALVRMGDLSKRVHSLPPDGSTPEPFAAYIQAMLGLMYAAIEQPGHPPWVHSDVILRDMHSARHADAVCVFRTSQAKGDLSRIRVHSLPVFFWIEDATLDGVVVHDMKQRVRDFQLDYRAKRGH